MIIDSNLPRQFVKILIMNGVEVDMVSKKDYNECKKLNREIHMELDELKQMLNTRLSTKADVSDIAEVLRISVPTMYRYKDAPEKIPYGVYLQILKYFKFSDKRLEEVHSNDSKFIEAEQRRLEFEKLISGGERRTVTPVYSVNCEIEEVTMALMSVDYPEYIHLTNQFIKIRALRRKEYEKGLYESYEIIDASKYRDFYLGVNRYSVLTKDVIDKQIDYLVKSMSFSHVHRRIYLYNTPELPVVSCYYNRTSKKELSRSLVRADDFVAYVDDKEADDLLDIFNRFFERAELYETEDVIDFLKNPMKFPLF